MRPLLAQLLYWPSLALTRVLCMLGLWDRWDWIDAHVLLGCTPTRRDVFRLRGLRIDSVLNLCDETDGNRETVLRAGMRHYRVRCVDYRCPTLEELLEAVQILLDETRAGRKVYLHCKAGRKRSPIVAMCYLVALRGLPAEDAYADVKRARGQADRRLFRYPQVRELERQVREGRFPPPVSAGSPPGSR